MTESAGNSTNSVLIKITECFEEKEGIELASSLPFRFLVIK